MDMPRVFRYEPTSLNGSVRRILAALALLAIWGVAALLLWSPDSPVSLALKGGTVIGALLASVALARVLNAKTYPGEDYWLQLEIDPTSVTIRVHSFGGRELERIVLTSGTFRLQRLRAQFTLAPLGSSRSWRLPMACSPCTAGGAYDAAYRSFGCNLTVVPQAAGPVELVVEAFHDDSWDETVSIDCREVLCRLLAV
jgi:hypothetical protein